MVILEMRNGSHPNAVIDMAEWLRRNCNLDAEELGLAMEQVAGPAAADTCDQLQASLASDAEPVEWWPEAA
jgi:hypothetical protein